jgi:hypothetical protein
MGFDMWLPPIFDPCDKKQMDRVHAGIDADKSDDLVAGIQRHFDRMRATGGCYREG